MDTSISDFEALRAYMESRGIAVAGLRDIVDAASKILEGKEELSKNERRVARLLWHLGLVVKTPSGKVRPTPQLEAVSQGNTALLAKRLARWTPMRILLRYMIASGGSATLEDVVRDLGGVMKRVTEKYLPVLKLAYPKLKCPVSKPFNKHVVDTVLFKLGADLGFLKYDRGRGVAHLTELAEEYVEQHAVEVIRTAPRSPIILAAVAATVTSARRVYLVSPWIDGEVAEALSPLLHGREVVVVTRKPVEGRQGERHRRALQILAQRGEVLCYERLHTKLAMGTSAVVTSANFTVASMLHNIETGVYYHETPTPLRVHAEEIVAAADTC
ncbi:MAG: hypothetical protein ACP5KA_06220 [Desulfurococcaceae archaeon]